MSLISFAYLESAKPGNNGVLNSAVLFISVFVAC